MTAYQKTCIRLMLMSLWYGDWWEVKSYAVEVVWPGTWERRSGDQPGGEVAMDRVLVIDPHTGFPVWVRK